MDYMTLKEASRKMECDTAPDKLFVYSWAHPRCCKNGDDLAYS